MNNSCISHDDAYDPGTLGGPKQKIIEYEKYARDAQSKKQWKQALQRWNHAITDLEQVPPRFISSKIHCLLQLGDITEAEQCAAQLIESHPNQAISYESQARVQQHCQKWDEALDYWEKAISITPRALAHYLTSKTNCLIKTGRLAEAEACAANIIDAFPAHHIGYEWQARVQQGKHEWQNALNYWKEAAKLAPDIPVSYLSSAANCLLKMGDISEAERHAAQIIEKYPDLPTGYEWQARAQQNKNDWKTALEYWNKALDRAAHSSSGLIRAKVNCLIHLGLVSQAEVTASNLIKMRPDEPTGYELLARAARTSQFSKLAIARWDDAIAKTTPTPALFYKEKAECLLQLRQYEDAEMIARTLVKEYSENSAGFELKAKIAQHRLLWDTSITLWKETIKRFPKNKQAHISLINTYIRKKAFHQAKTHFDIIATNFPDDTTWIKIEYAGFLERIGLYKEAIDHTEEILSTLPTQTSVLMIRARCFSNQGNIDLAEATLKKIATLNPHYYPAVTEAINLQRKQIKFEKTLSVLEEYSAGRDTSYQTLFHQFNYHLDKNDMDSAVSVSENIKRLPINEEPRDNLEILLDSKKHWFGLKQSSRIDVQNFSSFNEKFMATLRSGSSIKEVNDILNIAKDSFRDSDWFDYHHAIWLNSHNMHSDADKTWKRLISCDTQRHYIIGAINCAWRRADYKMIDSLCMEYTDHYPINTIIQEFIDKLILTGKYTHDHKKFRRNEERQKIYSGDKATTVLHSGDLGDIIYAMPIFKVLGNIDLYLTTTFETSRAMANRLPLLEKLCLEQDYINSVSIWNGEKIDYDLTGFRVNGRLSERSLAESQANYLFGDGAINENEQWLSITPSQNHGRVVFSRSARYRNHSWEKLWPVFKEMYPNAIFLGLESEYRDFSAGEFIRTNDLYEVADIIAGSSLFIGNQSSPFAIAEGLKAKRILEVSKLTPNASKYEQTASLF